MAYYIASIPANYCAHRQLPYLGRQMWPYYTSDWQDLALADAILEGIVKRRTSCDDWHAGTSRKSPVKRTVAKQTDTPDDGNCEREAVSGESVTELEQSHIEPNAKNFTLTVDVEHFSPDDLKVKLSDHVLTVTGESTETDTDGNVYSMYTFTREFTIPEDVDVTSLTSKLTGDGVLIFEAPRLALKEPTERHLPITVDRTDEPKEPTMNELTEETKSEIEMAQIEESLERVGDKQNVVDAEH
ncbi:uncharacterized protein LOC102802524 [Saccoglossus kowalevskii]|uniref:Heat shock protein beta-1-like n=1 Tax=Saccoglossus kowalevskii TaxID=10224 RepID=A0ABM0MS16_SACKO|nr:PREDICTED: heat shock protein beta-1-like [Saccoglossus kowalevskii]